MMKRRKREIFTKKTSNGQAAMEFLMSYGWAILVVIIAIGVLAYTGVFDPYKFLPHNCVLIPGLGCEDFNADATTGQVQFFISNGLGRNIDFTSMNIDIDFDGIGDCTLIDPPIIYAYGISDQINIPGCPFESSGERFSGTIIGNYVIGGGGLEYTMYGSLVTKVEGSEELIVVP